MRVTNYAALATLLTLASVPGHSQELSEAPSEVILEVLAGPIAEFRLLDNPLLYLKVPPPGSTDPIGTGVDFQIRGNAGVTVTATPSGFLFIPGQGHMGLALLNADKLGYKIQLKFPSNGLSGLPVGTAELPLNVPAPASLSANMLLATGGQADGTLHLQAHQKWTEHGGIPPIGIYVGEVDITLSVF